MLRLLERKKQEVGEIFGGVLLENLLLGVLVIEVGRGFGELERIGWWFLGKFVFW